ncbi:MAG: phosphoglucosamine mutase [Nitrososphaeria archaeon]|nr:phosphoglucosamine mutase [Nitrososphaeria archaeon]NIN52669.1 phosphoglucosamine mutase [Nitrososphaeria archaeon]NIQ33144.1 phosphoglucosamine mutase [Nitrososphaeria archaeon]
MSERLFGTNGFRGVVGKELTPEIAVKFGYAVGTHYLGKSVAVGWDGRLSSEMLSKALIAGLLSVASQVYEVGLTPIPALQKYVMENSEVEYGVMATASHNPPEYNGFKVIGPEGIEAHDSVEKRIEEIFLSGRYVLSTWREVKEVRHSEVLQHYLDSLLRQVDVDLLRRREKKVVVDPGHGVSALTIPHLLGRVGYKAMTINGDVDGRFPMRSPEPTPENLEVLSKSVSAVEADFGVAFDGDGDRVIFCDEEGKFWWGDASGIAISKYLSQRGICQAVVTPVTSSAAVEMVLRPLGIKVMRTQVGSRHVSYLMREIGSTWGFEENGGGIYAPHLLARDGGITTLLMAQLLAEEKKELSEVFGELPRLWQAKTKVKTRLEMRDKVVEALIEEHSDKRVETIDGAKIWFSDNEWVLVRPSGTEPLVRVFAESGNRDQATRLAREFKRRVVALTEDLA